ncbi:MAG TPA: AraC family transcriptional regulator [Steroidobacteraceae bacterium]
MTSSQLFFAVDIATVICNVLFGARVLAKRPHLLVSQLIGLITFNSVCHIVLSRYDYRYWIPEPYQWDIGGFAGVLNFARNLTPGLFMILCFEMFADRPRFPRALLGLFLLEMFFEIPMSRVLPEGPAGDIVTRIAPGLLQGLFAAFAIYWTVADWRADLIESRRRARAIIATVIGLNIIGSSVLLRVLISQNSYANYQAHLALILSNLLIVAFILIFMRDEDLQDLLGAATVPAQRRSAPLPAVAPETAAILTRLAPLMEVDRVYQRPSLSLKDLAVLVGAPEYRLRKIIHEQLGYPNFNVFLHSYRIREACEQLRDPAMRRIPILTIALSTGYQSINTFNRGFRDLMEVTPSAYRSRNEVAAPPAPKKISSQTA